MASGADQILLVVAGGAVGGILGLAGSWLGATVAAHSAERTTTAQIGAARDTATAQIESNSADIRAQIEASGWATRTQIEASAASIAAQIEADRAARMWDKRADVYTDVLAAVHYRRIKREHDIHHRSGSAYQRIEAFLAEYEAPDWFALEARMLAFGSARVFTVLQASSRASDLAYRTYNASIETQKATGSSTREMSLTPLREADQADDDFIETVRVELQGRGEPLKDLNTIL